MRRLLILAVLCQGLFAANPSACTTHTAQSAADEAEFLINKLHHHGYKFKLESFTEEQSASDQPSCPDKLALTLSETKCHIVNPKPYNECEVRKDYETPVTAKCNVTFCDGGEKPGIARLICDTEPASSAEIVRNCPDCPTLLPLHNPQGLESVKAAIEKFNKDSNQPSYFKLLEVGRLTTQYNMMYGMSQFAEFAIVETECPNSVENEEKPACKQKCPNEAHHGFCESTQLGNGDLTVNCEIYDIQNTTQHSLPPFHRGKHCEHHERHSHHPRHRERGENKTRPGHRERGEHESRPGHHEQGEHETRRGHPTLLGQPGDPEHAIRPDGSFLCFTRSTTELPFHRGKHHHAGPPDHAGPPHHAGPPDHAGPPHHAGPPRHKDHEKHDHDRKKPHPKPSRPPQQGIPNGQPILPESEKHPELSFLRCHGAVKIPPSIHPICPFPPIFYRRGH